MTEYDYSPEAYERYVATQHRIANWVDKTEQHRAEFQSTPPQDLSRSGPISSSNLRRSSPSPPRHQHLGQSQLYPTPSESESSDSDSYYEGPWPASMHQQSPPMLLPYQHGFQSPPPLHRVSHHHRHRPHDQRRSHSHQPAGYYSLASPPPGYQYHYPGGHQAYVMMPQYGGTQVPILSSSSQALRSAPATQPASYLQPQLQPGSQPSSPQQGWSPYGVPSIPQLTPLRSPPYVIGVPAYQPFVIQQPVQPSYLVPSTAHQRMYDLSKLGSNKSYYRRSLS